MWNRRTNFKLREDRKSVDVAKVEMKEPYGKIKLIQYYDEEAYGLVDGDGKVVAHGEDKIEGETHIRQRQSFSRFLLYFSSPVITLGRPVLTHSRFMQFSSGCRRVQLFTRGWCGLVWASNRRITLGLLTK